MDEPSPVAGANGQTPEYSVLRRQQESLRHIIELISSKRDLGSLLTQIVRLACELIGAERGTIGLVDEERDLVRTEAVYRMPPDELGAEMPRGVGLAGGVLATRAPVVLNRYGDLEQPVQQATLEDAVIGIPIFWQGRMIGFFGIGALPPRQFDEHDVETLTFFAHHAAIAITNAQLFEQTQRALEETRLLYETSQRISLAVDVGGVVNAYLEQVAARGRYACSIVLYRLNAWGERVERVSRGRWTPEEGLVDLNESHPYTRDALDPLLDEGQTVSIRDVASDPRVPPALREMQLREGRPSLAMIPLLARGKRIGLVVLSHVRAHEWSEADLWSYQTTAAQLATAIDSRRQQRLLYKRGQQVAVLEERQRLARELHDSVTQLLFSITLIAQAIAPAWRRDPAEGEHRVQRLLELSQAALAEMRALLVELRPAETSDPEGIIPPLLRVQQEGLVSALRHHVADLRRDGLEVEMEVHDAFIAAPLSREQEETLFRIAQESLHNVVKHARTRQASLTLGSDEDGRYLTIRDEGVGFDMDALPSPMESTQGGMGLPGIRERAEALGAILRLVSAPGRGTLVEVRLPGEGGEAR